MYKLGVSFWCVDTYNQSLIIYHTPANNEVLYEPTIDIHIKYLSNLNPERENARNKIDL